MFASSLPKLALRVGLAFVFLYAGIAALAQPEAWINWVPLWVEKVLSRDLFLQIHGVVEILFGISFLTGFLVRFTGILAVLDLAAIVVFSGLGGLSITFRDIGLGLATLGLTLDAWRQE